MMIACLFNWRRMGVKNNTELHTQYEATEPQDLLATARFEQCLQALHGDDSPNAILLRMRALLYLGKHHEVTRASLLEGIDRMPIMYRGRAMALLSTAYFRCGMLVAADSAMRQAYRMLRADTSGLAEAYYYDALHCWHRNELERAHTLLSRIINDARWRARALDLHSWILAKRSDYKGQLARLKDAFMAVQGNNVWEKAVILRSLSALARELYDDATARNIARHADQLMWTHETGKHEFYVYRYLAWCDALTGRPLGAYDRLARAQRCAESDAHLVLIQTDRATIARSVGENETFTRLLQNASHLADIADWSTCEEIRTGLLLLAELTATGNPKKAWDYVQQYTDIKTSITPILAFGNGDERLHALEQYTAGVVYGANGKRDEAVVALKEAFEIWRSAKYQWRAGLAAFQLGQITGRDSYLKQAGSLIRGNVPRAFFAGIVDSHKRRLEHPNVRALSKARRDVLSAFIEGLTNQEIAERLGVQEQTVKNTVRYLFKAFGARSSRDLSRILRERAIV